MRAPVPGTPQQFGLLGTWTIDCAQAPSHDNEYSIYAVSTTGEAPLVYARGEPYRDIVYAIKTVRIMTESRLALQVLRMPEKLPVDLVLRKEGDGIRVWSSHTPDGRLRVIDGVITGNEKASPQFKRCQR